MFSAFLSDSQVRMASSLILFSNISSTIDPTAIFSNLQSGNYTQLLSSIPLVQDKYQNLSSQFGNLPVNEFMSVLQSPNPQSIIDLTQNIMTNNISSFSGLDQINVANQLVNTLGMPPDPANLPNLLSNPLIQDNLLGDFNLDYLNNISQLQNLIMQGQLDPQSMLSMLGTNQLFSGVINQDKLNDFLGDYGGLFSAVLSKDPQQIAQSLMDQFGTNIDDWLAQSGLGSYLNINGLNQLLSGDIQGFVNNLASNYLDVQYLGDFQNLLSPIQDLLNGQISISNLNNLIGNFDDLFSGLNGNGITGDTIDDIQDFINGNLPTGLSGFISGVAPDIVFAKCRQKIAEDNVVHLTDIIVSFYNNPRILDYYEIPHDASGQLTGDFTDNSDLLLYSFYPRQVFSDFTDNIINNIAEKSSAIFNQIWPKDETGTSQDNLNNDIWKNDCQRQDNQYLQKCEQYIHVNF